MLISHFHNLLEFDNWANQKIIIYLENNSNNKALSLFSHIIADTEAWVYLLEKEKEIDDFTANQIGS